MSTYVIEPDDEGDLGAYIVEAVAPSAGVAVPEVDGRSELDAFVANILALDPLAVELWQNSPCAANVCSRDSARKQTEVPLWNARLSDAQAFYCAHALEERGVVVHVMLYVT